MAVPGDKVKLFLFIPRRLSNPVNLICACSIPGNHLMEGGIDLPVGEVSSAGAIDCPTLIFLFLLFILLFYIFFNPRSSAKSTQLL